MEAEGTREGTREGTKEAKKIHSEETK